MWLTDCTARKSTLLRQPWRWKPLSNFSGERRPLGPTNLVLEKDENELALVGADRTIASATILLMVHPTISTLTISAVGGSG